MSNHTPGPWEVLENTTPGYGYHVNAPSPVGYDVAIVCQHNRGIGETEYANARLIAAAPELLEACRLALDELGFLRNSSYAAAQVADACSAALAKAEGWAEYLKPCVSCGRILTDPQLAKGEPERCVNCSDDWEAKS